MKITLMGNNHLLGDVRAQAYHLKVYFGKDPKFEEVQKKLKSADGLYQLLATPDHNKKGPVKSMHSYGYMPVFGKMAEAMNLNNKDVIIILDRLSLLPLMEEMITTIDFDIFSSYFNLKIVVVNPKDQQTLMSTTIENIIHDDSLSEVIDELVVRLSEIKADLKDKELSNEI